MFGKIKDILFKIRDYDRLEYDYSVFLCYATDGLLSKTNYEIKGLLTAYDDIITEHDEQTIMETKECVIALIEARISEIQGDAQPRAALRAELRELMTKIKEMEI